jgi:hypothetical protein
MITRITLLLIAAFWVVMNVLLWRAEYGTRGSGISVPADLVWRKILTAPDASSLTVYSGSEKTGFCEFSTSVQPAHLQRAHSIFARPRLAGIKFKIDSAFRCGGNSFRRHQPDSAFENHQ